MLVSPVGASGGFEPDGRPTTYRRALGLLETGRVKVSSFITHRYKSLDEVPAAFAGAWKAPDYVKGAVEPIGGDTGEHPLAAHNTDKLSAMDRDTDEIRVLFEFQHQPNFGDAARNVMKDGLSFADIDRDPDAGPPSCKRVDGLR